MQKNVYKITAQLMATAAINYIMCLIIQQLHMRSERILAHGIHSCFFRNRVLRYHLGSNFHEAEILGLRDLWPKLTG